MIFEKRVEMKVKGIYLFLYTFIVVFLMGQGVVMAQQKPKSSAKTPAATTKTAAKKTTTKTDSVKKAIVVDSMKVVGADPTTLDSASAAKIKVANTKTTATKKGTSTGKKTDPKVKSTDPKKAGTDPKAKPAVVKLAPNIIKINSVGVLKIGMNVDTIKKIFPKDRVYKVYVYDQKNKYEQYQVTATDKTSQYLFITPECDGDSVCIIRQIIAKHPYFKTDRDISVGMLLDDLVLAYGYLESRWEEENLIVRNTEGIDFVMDTSGIPKRWYRKMNLDRLPLPTKIMGIMISTKEQQAKW
ncbi:hypothetical protein C3K47_15160 [Solitalea longa]|uniref:Uncharacterized protein n=1 Tax=Solitalea longa TaxID=2079460 RepID=A0A2S4ZZC4_9SPHI|nr:hypothetical protein [Solitalea longa]POY35399.1 hypothetical protein C3K47_15160 [Solitalea longa]